MGYWTGRWVGASIALVMQIFPAARVAGQDSTAVRVRVGPGFDAHSDRLASPFRHHGKGLDLDLSVVRNSLEVTLGVGSDRAGSRFETDKGGYDDLWTANIDVRWAKTVAEAIGGDVALGGGVGGVAFVRRHQYSQGYREVFADLAAPLFVSAGYGRAWGKGGARLDERLDVALVTLMFRSPFAGTKGLPPSSLAGPWSTQVVRHRLRISTRASRRVRLFVTHGLTLLATDRERPLRVVRQDLSFGIGLVLGGGVS